MVALAQASVNDVFSPTASARRLAGRLEHCGKKPYQSERERYLVLIQDAPGEIIPLGRPLRSSRFFKPTALKRDIPMVRALEDFAAETSPAEWMFWNVGLTGKKAEVGNLQASLAEFNRLLNLEFTELRKNHGFELLLVAIHPRYDAYSGCFDLHAHFVCRIPQETQEAVRRRLMTRFSKVDLPDARVRHLPAVATYMLWGIFDPKEMETWPDAALAAAWEVASSKARLVRVGKVLSDWRRARINAVDGEAARIERARVQRNRLETADRRKPDTGSDRFLTRVIARIGGVKVAALLFEEAGSPPSPQSQPGEIIQPEMYPSATSAVSQDPASTTENGDGASDGPANAPTEAAGRRVHAWAASMMKRTGTAVAKAMRACWGTLKAAVDLIPIPPLRRGRVPPA